MKAIAFNFKTDNGTPHMVETTKPTPGEKDLIVKVSYSAIDTAPQEVIHKRMMGYFVHDLKVDTLLLGWHFSGIVAETGSGVKGLKVGEKVYGFLQYEPKQKQGTFAEYIRVEEEACALVPDGLDMKTVAAATTEALTALQAIRNLGGLTNEPNAASSSSQRSILVLGAGGGVGSAAVGIAKKMGARVTAVCGTKDVARVESFGADEVIDRSKHKDIFKTLRSRNKTYDVVFDAPVKYSAVRSFKLLRKGGAYVTTIPTLGMLAGKFVALFNGKRVCFVECHSNREDLDLLSEWLQSGLQIDVDSVYPVKDMNRAMERQASRVKAGRVAIQVDGGW